MNSPVLTMNAEGKILYAIVAECVTVKHRKRYVKIDTIYTHAETEGEARFLFSQDPDYGRHRIIAVAPAIGYHVADNHGDRLIA